MIQAHRVIQVLVQSQVRQVIRVQVTRRAVLIQARLRTHHHRLIPVRVRNPVRQVIRVRVQVTHQVVRIVQVLRHKVRLHQNQVHRLSKMLINQVNQVQVAIKIMYIIILDIATYQINI